MASCFSEFWDEDPGALVDFKALGSAEAYYALAPVGRIIHADYVAKSNRKPIVAKLVRRSSAFTVEAQTNIPRCVFNRVSLNSPDRNEGELDFKKLAVASIKSASFRLRTSQ